MATQYDKQASEELIKGFTEGFSIGYHGPKNRKSLSNNIPFTRGVGDKFDMWSKIMNEVSENRVAGPFEGIPFDNYIQSPIGLVPKSGGKTCLIFHLSYNFGDDGLVNHHTPKDLCSVQYNDLDFAIKCCLRTSEKAKLEFEMGVGGNPHGWVYLSKTDLRSAFRMLLVSPRSWCWLIFKAENPSTGRTMFFVDKCLPFGASISCSLFQKFSNALRHIVSSITGREYAITNYLDDFLFTETTTESSNSMVRSFLKVCDDIRLPVADDKTECASLRIVFLGLLLDGQNLLLGVPLDKRQRALDILNMFIDKKKATLKQLQALAGYLNFLSRAVHPSRCFTRRMYAKFSHLLTDRSGKHKLYHHVRLDREFKFDCEVWRIFLSMDTTSVVLRPLIDLYQESTSVEMDFYSDSSASESLGFGVVFGRHWMFGAWPPQFIRTFKPSIAYLELFALVAGILAWETEICNIRMIIYCDNQSVVEMVNKNASSCSKCMFLLRLLVLSGIIHNRRIFVRYIKSKDNLRADLLSRLKINKFIHISAADIDPEPTSIPDRMWPIEKLWSSTPKL